MEIELWIAGEPQGKQRARMGKSGHVYTPKKTENAEANIVAIWREGGELRMPEFKGLFDVERVNVAIKLDILILVERPGSHFNSKGELNLEGQRHPLPENKKPDVDNAQKLIMDALNKRAYKDDVKVTDARQRRRWSKSKSGIIVTISEDTDYGDLP